MTEYEMADLLTSTSFAAVESFSAYVALMVAFLVATYFAGQNMTRSQVVLVSMLYSISALLMTWTTYTYMSRSIPLADALEVLNPKTNYGAQPFARNIVATLEVLGVLCAIKFMWDVRHPKTE
jgi:uncharacterized membrane protein YqjE